MRTALLALTFLSLARAAAAQQATSPAITPADLRLRVGILADDSMAGRGLGTPGLERAAAYVARELARMGLRPAGTDGYRFPVELERSHSAVAATVVRHGRADTLTGDALVLLSGSSGFPPGPRASGEGRVLFGGFLVDTAREPAEGMNTERLTGAVLMLQAGSAANLPASPRYSLPSLAGAYSPLSALLLVTDDTANWAYLRDLARSGAVSPRTAAASPTAGPAVFAITRAAADRIAGRALANEHGALDSLGTFHYALSQSRAPLPAADLVAVLPGRDSALASEYLVLGAHLDHLGVGTPMNGDSIYNGADDDASGSAALLEVAEQLAALPMDQRPARSVLFIWHSAEEDGMLGSRAFSERPTVPRARMVGMLNLDMVGRNSPDSLYVIGSRRLSTALGDALERANAALAQPFHLDYALDSPDDPEHLYCRSDHYSYARFMVPVAFLTGGLHADYHRPSDEAATLSYEKLARVGELTLAAVREIGSLPRRPAVDRPLPPLGEACR